MSSLAQLHEIIHHHRSRVELAAAKIGAAPNTQIANDWLHAKQKHEGYVAALLDIRAHLESTQAIRHIDDCVLGPVPVAA